MPLTKTTKNRLKKKIKNALPENATVIEKSELARLSEGTPFKELYPILRELGVFVTQGDGTPEPSMAETGRTGTTLDGWGPIPDRDEDPRDGQPTGEDDNLLSHLGGGGSEATPPPPPASPIAEALSKWTAPSDPPAPPAPRPRPKPETQPGLPDLPTEFVRRQIADARIYKSLDSLSHTEGDVRAAFVLTTLGQLERERAALRQWIEALGGVWPEGGGT